MKKLTLILLLSMVTVFAAQAHKHSKGYVTISIQNFYDELSPYGDWVYTPDYGYTWRPYFDYPEAFRPYSSNGHWVNTEYGWTWVSDYSWGWATFHYGRWAFDDYLGWMWVPGTEWAPAWVTWGSYDNCWGWAPLGPDIYAGYNNTWYAPVTWWTFVPRVNFCSTNWNHYIYNRPVYVTNITNITNVYVNNNNYNSHNSWYYGPRVSEVERYSNTRVRRMEIQESERPENAGIRNDRLSVYRPAVESRRQENRPAEYRNIEQARTSRRIEQTDARTNDPGANRTRGVRTEARTITQLPVARTENGNRENRTETRTTTQVQNSRTTEVPRDARVAPRTTTQTESRTGSVNRENRVEPRKESQAPVQRNSVQTATENRREAPVQERNSSITERNRPAASPTRVENTETYQNRGSASTQENVNRNSARETGNRQSPAANPAREQRTQKAAPTTTSRPENTERRAEKQDVKKAESRNSGENTTRNSSANPARR
jgi:hypothetical protein